MKRLSVNAACFAATLGLAIGCSSGSDTSAPSPKPPCALPPQIDAECFDGAECTLLYVAPCDGGTCWDGRCVR